MAKKYVLYALALALPLVACPKRTTRSLAEYQLDSRQIYIGGRVIDLYESQVLNRRDFAYSIAFNADSRLVAYPHMVLTDFELSLNDVDSGTQRWQVPLQATEFDSEGLAFVGSSALVAVSRRNETSTHPTLRLLSQKTGETLATATSTDARGLTQVAVSADATRIATVSYMNGDLVLRRASDLAWLGEIRAHRGPATAVAFGPDGRIYTGGQDGMLSVWSTEDAEIQRQGQAVLAALTVGDPPQRALRALVNRRQAATLALDAGASTSVITRSLAKRLGLAVDGPTRELRIGSGSSQKPGVRLSGLLFKDLELGDVEAVVCETCVPLGCDGVLGQDLSDRLTIETGLKPHLLRVKVRSNPPTPNDTATPDSPDPAKAAPGSGGDVATTSTGIHVQKLSLLAQHKMPGAINDIRLSRDGRQLVLAISSEPAERSLQLYEREKKGEYPEPSPTNAALLVDARSGKVVKTFVGHRGYVVTADISPDGKTVASGGWDNHFMLFDVDSGRVVVDRPMAWLLRRVRFAPDGRSLGVAAWTPPASSGEDSDPSAVLFDIVYQKVERHAR